MSTFSEVAAEERAKFEQSLVQSESKIKNKIDDSTDTIVEEVQKNRRAALIDSKFHSIDCKERHKEQMAKSSSIEDKQDFSLEKSDVIISTIERMERTLKTLVQSDLDALNGTTASDNMKALQDGQYDVSAVPTEILTNDNASETTGNNSSILSSSSASSKYQPEKVKFEDTATVSTASTAVASSNASSTASFTFSSNDEGKENVCNRNISTPLKEKNKSSVNSSFGHKTPSSSVQGRLGLGARPPLSSQRAREANEKYLSARKKRINQEQDKKKMKEKGRPLPKT